MRTWRQDRGKGQAGEVSLINSLEIAKDGNRNMVGKGEKKDAISGIKEERLRNPSD